MVAVYPVTPGQILNIFVGGIPYNGGGNGGGSIAQANGGGSSDVRIGGIALANRVIVAGGGGGNNCSANAEPGGAGGGLIGSSGWQCGNQTGTAVGQGGTQMAGGAAGTSPSTPGSFGVGGNAGGLGTASGGGGGGYYGGGGAAFGGGGSSYTDLSATAVTHTQGFNNGTGIVIISYGPSAVAITSSSLNICSGSTATLSTSSLQTYSWSNGATTATSQVSLTVATTYSLEGTDLSGCLVAGMISIGIISSPTISVNSGSICAGQSFTMVPSGATTYTYSNGTDVVTPTTNDSYTVTGTDANGCANTAVSTVIVNALPTVSVNSGSICAGTSFTMVPTGADTYTYSNGTNVVTPAANDSYTVAGTDANGCANTAVSSVTINALPTISVNSSSICTGQSFTMVPSGAVTYTYSNGSSVVTPTANATYSVSGTDANGCVSSVDAVSTIAVNSLPVLTASTNNTLLCVGEIATLSVAGATTYTWSTTETTTNIAVTPTVQTTYTVDGTDANGCSNTTTITQDVSLCTGITALVNDVMISVYPNPNNGLFVLELTSSSKVTVTNALGQIVISETFEFGKHNLDIHNEATGVYFVKVIENNRQQIIKIIKQ